MLPDLAGEPSVTGEAGLGSVKPEVEGVREGEKEAYVRPEYPVYGAQVRGRQEQQFYTLRGLGGSSTIIVVEPCQVGRRRGSRSKDRKSIRIRNEQW